MADLPEARRGNARHRVTDEGRPARPPRSSDPGKRDQGALLTGIGKRRPRKPQSATKQTPAGRAKTPSKATRPTGEIVGERSEAAASADTPCYVVGVGASAGGLDAFIQLLRALPADTGMAFVLVQHLSPTHESSLAEILSRSTTMPVTEVADEPELAPDHVYVIPPDKNIVIDRGHLLLLMRETQGKQHPIDQFFRSLAESRGHTAIGVVLSGTATDGTLGLESIKAHGGITFAQDESAQQRGMPLSAVASGCVDFVLPPQEIAAELARIASRPDAVRQSSGRARIAKAGVSADRQAVSAVLQLLRNATGVDFANYRTSSTLRRIKRRVLLLKKDGLADYERHLRDSPEELEALYQDILINVTGFFRDPETFEALRVGTIPHLIRNRSSHDPVRVWVVGCSTGEEAYSLAMILAESYPESDGPVPAKIFATDLNPAAIQHARAGVYTKQRLQGVSPERVRRFFVEHNGDFRVAKPIRDLCVFSPHNVLNDPPFSRMDLVSCRNLLIYLDASLQRRVLPLLHFALKPKGTLLLGASETIGRFRDLFEVQDSTHKIFTRLPGPGRGTSSSKPLRRSERALRSRTGLPRPAAAAAARPRAQASGLSDKHGETDRLLASFAPPAVLVNSDFDVLQIRGDVDPYLTHGQGNASLAVLTMAREGLLVPLQALLQRARQSRAPVREANVRIVSPTGTLIVDLEAVPLERSGGHEHCFLVLFKSAIDGSRAKPPDGVRKRADKPAGKAAEHAGHEIARLEHELARTREHLRVVMQQHMTANDELQSSNEEIQASNEELQSINEELETTKEEIQASNEELTTVNDELQNRNAEVGHLFNDLTNLINSVELPIIIVGRDLRIRRFSPTAEKHFGLTVANIGQSVATHNLSALLPGLDAVLDTVIDTSMPQERTLHDSEGHWWSLRVRPYLTMEKKIDGAVLMLVDVDELKRREELIATSRDHLRKWEQIFEHAGWAVATIKLPEGLLDLVNPAFATMHGYTVEALRGRPLSDLLAPVSREFQSSLTDRADAQDDFVYESVHLRKDGSQFPVLTHVTSLRGLDGRKLFQAATFQDITDRNRLEQDLKKRNDELAETDRAKNHFISVLSHELRSPLNVLMLWSHIIQRPGCSAEDMRTGLRCIDESSRAQSQLIEDLMDVQRISIGKVRLELAPVDVRSMVRSIVEAMLPLSEKHGLRLELLGDPEPVLVSGDEARLGQVLRNLLDNALKFTERGGEVGVDLRREGGSAVLVVSDTGQGIPAEALPHIFDRFRRPDTTPAVGRHGLGLGLSIARQLVELHGGTITAASPGVDRGATFTISLPLLPSASTPPLVPSTPDASVSLGGITVLVVDDEFDQRLPIATVLKQAGAEVVSVGSGQEALASLRTGLPDVIVSDIGMPEQNGYDLLRAIRALPSEGAGGIPAIALTAYGAPDDVDKAFDAGFRIHLAKPVESIALLAAVVELARDRGTRATAPLSPDA